MNSQKLTISVVFLAILFLSACDASISRPDNIPESAQWVGGGEGGDWIDCEKISSFEMKCSIYSEVSGTLIDAALFVSSKGTVDDEIDFYDGDKIVTKNGSVFIKR